MKLLRKIKNVLILVGVNMIMWPYKFVHALSPSEVDKDLNNVIQCLYGPPPDEPMVVDVTPISVKIIARFAYLVVVPLVACIGAFVWCKKSMKPKKYKIVVVLIAIIIALISITIGRNLFAEYG